MLVYTEVTTNTQITNIVAQIANYNQDGAGNQEINTDPVSSTVRQAITNFNLIMIPFISLFGIVGNIINILVFVKQGFKNSMNVSLLGR